MAERKCPKCRQQRLVEVSQAYSTSRDHDGRTYPIVIPNLELLLCEACGNRIIPAKSDDQLSDALRLAAGLLSPQELRNGRRQLGLTQERMANDLGIAEATLSRWETGAQIQQRAFDKLLRAYFELPEFRAYLAADSARLPVVNTPAPHRVGDGHLHTQSVS